MTGPSSVSPQRPSRSTGLVKLLLVGLGACVAFGLWLLNDDQPKPEARDVLGSETLPAAVERKVAHEPIEPLPERAPTRVVAATHVAAETGADLHGVPHPITAEHLKNYRQVELLHEAWQKLKQGEYDAGRQIVSTLRREYPEQWEDMNEGLETLADCMQRPSPETLAAAQRFYDERTASMMRKRIRRYCLEPHAATSAGN